MNFQNYLSILNSGDFLPHIKVELLRFSDETPYQQMGTYKDVTTSSNSTASFGHIPNTVKSHFSSLHHSGNLNIQRANGVRRTVDLTLINTPDNPNYIDPNMLYIRSKFQLYLGLEDGSQNIEWFPHGLFVINDPSVVSNYSNGTIAFQGIDKFGLWTEVGGELDSSLIIPLGSSVIGAIQSTLTLAGDIKKPIIDTYLVGKTVPYTMTYKIGDKIGQVLIDLAQLYSCNIYYDEIGQLVIERDIPDEIKSSQWDFTTEQFHYMGAKNDYRFSELYNAVLVVGSNINGQTVSYKARNMNLLSPTSIPNVGFERVFYYQSDNLSTVQECQDLANYILYRKTAVQNEVEIYSTPMLHILPDQIITLTDSSMNLNRERYIVNKLTIPLKIGDKCTLDVVKSKEIPFI